MWSQETRSCFIPWCPWWSVAPETHLWSYGSWAAHAALANEATEQRQAALPDRSCSLAGFAASASVAVAGVLKQKCMISTAYPWEEKIIKIEMIEDTHFKNGSVNWLHGCTRNPASVDSIIPAAFTIISGKAENLYRKMSNLRIFQNFVQHWEKIKALPWKLQMLLHLSHSAISASCSCKEDFVSVTFQVHLNLSLWFIRN